jgi:hypothetical protein
VSVPVATAAYPDAALAETRSWLRQGMGGTPEAALAVLDRASLCVPVGVQLIGRLCDERTLLRVAAVLEARAGFTAPAYVAGAAAASHERSVVSESSYGLGSDRHAPDRSC